MTTSIKPGMSREQLIALAERRKVHIELQLQHIKSLKKQLDKYPNLWKLACGHFEQVSSKWNVPDHQCSHCKVAAEALAMRTDLEKLREDYCSCDADRHSTCSSCKYRFPSLPARTWPRL